MAKKKYHTITRTYRIIGFFFLLPAILIYSFFAVIPVFDNVILSFQKWNGFTDRSFIGIQNYIEAFKDTTFIIAIKNSVYIAAVSTFFSVIIGVILAWLLLFIPRKIGGFYRTIIFSPSMIPPVITALVFSFVYEPEVGILNNILEFLNMGSLKAAWLTNKGTVINCITFVSCWKQIGLTMVLCFAGMQAIPLSLFESASIEGATNFQIFGKIILPLIMPYIQISTIFALMAGLRIYDTVLALTDGGPGVFSIVMPMWIMEQTFVMNHYGYGAGMAIIYVVIVLIGVIIVRRLLNATSYEL
ncbi:MAG: sugar ABC transporter permease [Chitinispirillia bacterium]|jgi:raffinose/stachyose/melibiose transport system permease protein